MELIHSLRSARARVRGARVLLAAIAAALSPFHAGRLDAQQALKGVWEPVNYKGDLHFTDVFFVTPDEGWVAGYAGPVRGGVILHTSDAGLTWKIQFGDPESNDREIRTLFFLDATHGWATRPGGSRHTLLRTTDGENWDEAGTVPGNDFFIFTTPMTGFASVHDEIQRTDDGGQHWTSVAKCHVTVEVNGLTHEDKCSPWAIHFPTPQVGYAVGKGSSSYIALMRTHDGGATWTVTAVPADDKAEHVFFTSERTGFVRVGNGKLYRTDDGGDSWRALPASAPREVLFADPEVGWSMRYRSMLFTANAGKSWSTREIQFPTTVNAFSLPRRDRGYAVGDHGMIYRYRLVSQSTSTPGALPAPAMPAFDAGVLDTVNALGAAVRQLAQAVESAPAASPGSKSASLAPSTSTDSSGGTASLSGEPVSADASAFVSRCCARSLPKFRLALVALSTVLPQFLERFRNVNVVAVGLRMLSELPTRLRAVSVAYRDFSHSQDKSSAKAAVAQLAAAVDSLTEVTRSTVQTP
jgi:photosystem II stability/assembly factor-like uncharacterized protein